MTDSRRAEITNAIWLCRNCHKLIDTDEQTFSHVILFAWREKHEEYIFSELGSPSEKLRYELKLEQFQKYPSIVKRIIIDKPLGWEWRLGSELMRYFNNPLFRKFDDLREGLYVKPIEFVESDKAMKWIRHRLLEVQNFIPPLKVLLDRLNLSFGKPGEPGSVDEIMHITHLIKDFLEQVLLYEERLYFVKMPEEYINLVYLLINNIGSQAKKLSDLPNSLDEVVSLIGTDHGGTVENPIIIEKTLRIELPDGWADQFTREMEKVMRGSMGRKY